MKLSIIDRYNFREMVRTHLKNNLNLGRLLNTMVIIINNDDNLNVVRTKNNKITKFKDDDNTKNLKFEISPSGKIINTLTYKQAYSIVEFIYNNLDKSNCIICDSNTYNNIQVSVTIAIFINNYFNMSCDHSSINVHPDIKPIEPIPIDKHIYSLLVKSINNLKTTIEFDIEPLNGIN